MPMPLEGIRVLDWTQWQMGPVASMMLGDLGADVIKIEDRVMGDAGRGIMKAAGAIVGVAGRNFYFETGNRNKRGLTIDLKKDSGRDVIYKLVEKSDVFIHNFRKGVPHRLGLDYETLSRHNPRLIYANCSGFGSQGPDSGDPAFDFLGLARSGIMTMVGEPDMPPLVPQGGIADQVGGVMAAYAVLAALLARERLGMGQEIDVSLLGSMTWLQEYTVAAKLILGQEFKRHKRSQAGNPLWNYYQCGDGKWISLANPQADRQWPGLCKALGIEHLRDNPKFADLAAREANAAELISIMDEVFRTRTREEWLKVLRESGDIVCTPLNTITDLVNDPQMLANDYIIDFNHPVWGKVKVVGIPAKFSKTPGAVRREAPEFGQHTEEILIELLGYSWEEIAKLKDGEVI